MRNIVVKNFSWSLAGNIVYALSQWLMIIVIAKLGNAEELGYFSLGLAITSPLMLFLNLRFSSILSTDLLEKFGFNTFMTIRIYTNIIFSLSVICILIFSNYQREVIFTVLVISSYKIVESFSDLNYGFLQRYERLDLVAKSNIYRGISSSVSFIVLYYLTNNLPLSLLAIFFPWLINLVLFDNKNRKKVQGDFFAEINFDKSINLVRVSLPLGIVAFISSINVNIPRITIEKYLTFEELGYFTSVFYLVLIVGKFMTSMGGVVLPRMAKLFENHNYRNFLQFYIVTNVLLVLFSMVLIFVSYFFGDIILSMLYGKDFMSLRILFFLIMIYGLFYYLGYIAELSLNAMKFFQYRISVEVLAALFLVFLSFILVPKYALNGAAVALIITSLLKWFILSILFTIKFRALSSRSSLLF